MNRTLEKRQAILDAAAAVFRDQGYERASMSDIGLRTGCSKTTLYGYLRAQMDAGILRRGGAHGSARQFRALLDASWFDRVLFDCGAGPGPGQVEQELQFALAAFLRAWEPAPETKRATRTLPLTDPA